MTNRDPQPVDVRVTITPDLPITPAWSALWRRLLAPTPAGDLPGIADAIGSALSRAEDIAAPIPEPAPPTESEQAP